MKLVHYIILQGYHSIIVFNVIKSPSNPFILGLFWLDKYNPIIDWKTWRLAFEPNITSIQEYDYGESSSILDHQQFKSHHRKLSKIQVPLVVGAKAFMRPAKKRTMFAIYAMPIIESIKGPEALLTHYKKYQDVFEKKNIDMLPQHCPCDCVIDHQDGTELPFGLICKFSQNELTALWEYLNEILIKNFIQHSKSSTGASIFFIKKKDGLLWLWVNYRDLNKIKTKN